MGGAGGWWQVRKACMAGSRNGSERGRAVGCTLLPWGTARCDAWPSSGGASSTRTTTASPPRRRVAREEALRGGFSRTSTRTRRTSTRTTRTTRGLRSARRGPSQGCEELVCCSIFTGFSRCRPGGGLTAWGSRHDSYGLWRRTTSLGYASASSVLPLEAPRPQRKTAATHDSGYYVIVIDSLMQPAPSILGMGGCSATMA